MHRLLLCLFLLVAVAFPAAAVERFMRPDGADTGEGPEGAPWRTFGFAIPRLGPGDILTLLNGEYTTSHSGGTVTSSTDVLSINCESGGNAQNGTSSNRITVRAKNDRQALLQGSGKIVVYLWRCSWWNLEGLYVRNIDVNPGSGFEGSNLVLNLSDHINVKRNLIYWPNSFFNSHGIALYNSNMNLIEENEVYGAPRHGIIQGHDTTSDNPSGNIVRRNYVNGRQHATMAGGFTCPGSCENTTTDEGISLYPGQDALFENNIVEDAATGFSIQGKKDPFNNKYFGNIAGPGAGQNTPGGGFPAFGFGPRDGDYNGTDRQMPTDIVMENNVIVGNTYMGCGSCKRLTWKNFTFIGGTTMGMGAGSNPGQGDGHNSITGTNLLVMNNAGVSYDINNQESQSFDYLRNYNNADNSFPAGATHTSTNDPNMGTCLVYIPSTSNLKGAGLDGADIGANVLYQYLDGAITTTPLWDPASGRFSGCGAIITGVNDNPATSCFNVHARLNVGPTGGCAFPAGYGGTGTLPPVTATYYVAPPPTGSDTLHSCADATEIGKPKQTFASAIACAASGSTILARQGVYPVALDTGVLAIRGGTSWANPTTIAAYQNEVVTLQNPGGAAAVVTFRAPATDPYIVLAKLRLDGANVSSSNGLRVTDGSHHVRFQQGEVFNTTVSGIFIADVTNVEVVSSRVHHVAGGIGAIAVVNTTTDILIQGNEIDTNQNSGINLDHLGGTKTNTIIVGNTLHGNSTAGKAGMELTGSGRASNNLVWGNAIGMHVKPDSSNFQVYNNSITLNTNEGVLIDSGAIGTAVTNNLTFGNGTPLISNDASTTQTTNLSTDPLYVDATVAHNFHLQAGSPARNTGTNLAEVPLDYANVTRPQPAGGVTDIGAYEYVTVGGVPQPPTGLLTLF